MKPEVCKCCGQVIPPKMLFLNSPVKRRIYEFISKHPEGVARSQILDYVYRDDPDGGPSWPGIISVHLRIMRRVMAEMGITIHSSKGPAARYTVRQL